MTEDLLVVLDRFRGSEEHIAEQVAATRGRIAEETGLEGDRLRDAVVQALIDDAAVRSGLIGAIAALPFVFPYIGPWLSLAAKVGTGTVFQIANEVSLVHGIAAAYGQPIDAEKLRMVAFWLVRLTNYDDLRDRALAMGVRISVRRLVEKLIAVGLTRAAAATAAGMMTGFMGARSGARPWYVVATGFLGVPVLAVLGYRSTQAVGDRARAYFSEAVAMAPAR